VHSHRILKEIETLNKNININCYYNGVENLITCKCVYDCKTWLGMHTTGKLLIKSRYGCR
jgi:hypothetical protein